MRSSVAAVQQTVTEYLGSIEYSWNALILSFNG